MKLTMDDTRQLAAATKTLKTLAHRHTPKPILQCVRLSQEGEVLMLHATDLETEASWAIVTRPGADPFPDTCIDADLFHAIVAKDQDSPITIEAGTNGHARINHGGRFKLAASPGKDFPEMGKTTDVSTGKCAGVRLPTEWLASAVKLMATSVAKESTRYAINGVLLEIDDNRLTIVATDGRRLSWTAYDEEYPKGDTEPASAIVPLKPLSMAAAKGEFVDVMIGSDGSVAFDAGDYFLRTRTIEGRFPQWREIVPDKGKAKTVRVDRAKFVEHVSRVMVTTDPFSRGMVITAADGDLTLETRSGELGQSEVTMECEYSGDDAVRVGLNAQYVLEAARAMCSETLEILVINKDKPVVLVARDMSQVIMPIMIGD